MMLDNYVRDFKALIDWIHLQEKLENTDAENRCPSVDDSRFILPLLAMILNVAVLAVFEFKG